MADEREVNPYESPRAEMSPRETLASDADPPRREGDVVFIGKEGRMPQRCIICNHDAGWLVNYSDPAYWLCGWHKCLQVGVALIAIAIGVCAIATSASVLLFWLLGGGSLRSILTMLVAMFFVLPAFGLPLWEIIACFVSGVRCTAVDDKIAIRGCGKEFLASLPTREEVERNG